MDQRQLRFQFTDVWKPSSGAFRLQVFGLPAAFMSHLWNRPPGSKRTFTWWSAWFFHKALLPVARPDGGVPTPTRMLLIRDIVHLRHTTLTAAVCLTESLLSAFEKQDGAAEC